MQKIFALSFREKRILFEAVCFLLGAKLLLWILPFRTCLKLVKMKGNHRTPLEGTLKEIRNALYRANRLAIWKNVCLVQSFAARWMLNRRKIESELYIGVKQSAQEDRIEAHAWIVSHGVEIVKENSRYEVLMII